MGIWILDICSRWLLIIGRKEGSFLEGGVFVVRFRFCE